MSEIPQVQNVDVADDAVILDVREQDEWDAGHAPGALHIPLGELPSRLHEVPDTDDGTLAVTCRGGGRSSRAVAWLSRQGFDVANLEGGMKGWAASGKTVVAESGEPRVI